MANFLLTTGADAFTGAGLDSDTFSGPGGGSDTLNGGGGADQFIIDSSQTGSIVGGSGLDVLMMSDGPGEFNNQLDLGLTISGVETFIASITNIYATTSQLTTFSTITAGAGGSDFFVFLQGDGGVLNFSSKFTSGISLHVEAALVDSAVNLTGTSIADDILGSSFNDRIDGGGGGDAMNGAAGNDTYVVDKNGASGDIITEGVNGGSDTVLARVSYTLGAGVQVEKLQTIDSAATTTIALIGNEFANTITGNAGANVIYGRGGNDVLRGNGGADSFVFDRGIAGTNIDHITDFAHGVDKIRLDATIFTTLAPGALADSAFKDLALGAEDADDRVVYNSVTGVLFYDADGAGGASAKQVAVLDNHATLTSADFLIVA